MISQQSSNNNSNNNNAPENTPNPLETPTQTYGAKNNDKKDLSLEYINSMLSNDITEHKDNSKLDNEASKLFQTFQALKHTQKGFLSNLIDKQNQSNVQQSSATMNNINLTSNQNLSSNTVGNADTNALSSSDNTLGEIEKQIKLLNSLNASK